MEAMEVRAIFAENLKKLRRQKGLSQMKLANELQMAFTFINDIENCKKWVSPETLARFATFFGVPVSALFSIGGEGGKNLVPDLLVETICDEVVRTIRDVKGRFS